MANIIEEFPIYRHKRTGINGWAIHHWLTNNPSQQTVVALHGLTGCGLDFEHFGRHGLGNCDWVAPDLPGHGFTQLYTAGQNNFDGCVQHLSKSIDLIIQIPSAFAPPPPIESGVEIESESETKSKNKKRLQLKKPILLGYSMGGRFALGLALRYPSMFSKLILISTRPGFKTPQEQDKRIQSDSKWIEILQTQGIEAFYNAWENQPIIASQKNIPLGERVLMRQRRLHLNTIDGLIFAFEKLGSGAMPSFWNILSEITIPTLLLSGKNDIQYSQQIHKEMFALIPQHLRHEAIIQDSGHAPLWENRYAFTQAIERFLS